MSAFVEQEKILRQLLIGNSFGWFSLGDTWTINFLDEKDRRGLYLVAQAICSPREASLSEALSKIGLMDSIDAEDIPNALMLMHNRRKTITDLSLDSKATLSLRFEDENELSIPTNVDIVDWQWCLNDSGADPYMSSYEIACFWSGEIVLPNKK